MGVEGCADSNLFLEKVLGHKKTHQLIDHELNFRPVDFRYLYEIHDTLSDLLVYLLEYKPFILDVVELGVCDLVYQSDIRH